MMLQLQDRGCHNINFVTPEHVVPQILQALSRAIDAGLRLPIVHNTSCYDSLAVMDGIVDIYLPDLKVWTPGRARRYLRMPGYPVKGARGAECIIVSDGLITYSRFVFDQAPFDAARKASN
jgi:uncharacterized Fe-S radical SAM superfamily protein PflX